MASLRKSNRKCQIRIYFRPLTIAVRREEPCPATARKIRCFMNRSAEPNSGHLPSMRHARRIRDIRPRCYQHIEKSPTRRPFDPVRRLRSVEPLGLPDWSTLIAFIAKQLDYEPEVFKLNGNDLQLAQYYVAKKGRSAHCAARWTARFNPSDDQIENPERTLLSSR